MKTSGYAYFKAYWKDWGIGFKFSMWYNGRDLLNFYCGIQFLCFNFYAGRWFDFNPLPDSKPFEGLKEKK